MLYQVDIYKKHQYYKILKIYNNLYMKKILIMIIYIIYNKILIMNQLINKIIYYHNLIILILNYK